jgi:glycosyltransferase involved in cell wall biosynthesis
VKSGEILKYLFKFQEATVYTYRLEYITKRFLTSFAVRLLTLGRCQLIDEENKSCKITIPFLTKLFFRFIIDLAKKPVFIVQETKKVEGLSVKIKTQEGKNLNTPLSNPIYLRTDFSFGLKAGGSVGHTIGVIIGLKILNISPLIISSIKIPTLSDSKNIDVHELIPKMEFNDFPELPQIAFNNQIIKFVQNFNKTQNFSFIYQRYSIHNYSGFYLAHILKIPFILEYNGSEVWVSQNWGTPLKYKILGTKIENLNLLGADVIVVVSKALSDELVERNIDKNKILVNPNGVNPELYSPEIDGSHIRSKYDIQDKTVIGFIGTFGQWHGAEILADAFGLLLKKYPEYRSFATLFMIGDGLTLPSVKEILTKHNAHDNTVYTGLVEQNEGAAYLAACDILASPHVPNSDGTPFFGSPTKLFEYMAMGKGIVGSDLEQIGEVLEHNKTALLVPPADPQALMNEIKNLIDNPELRNRLGKSAREEVIKQYTWKEHTRRIIDKLKERCG